MLREKLRNKHGMPNHLVIQILGGVLQLRGRRWLAPNWPESRLDVSYQNAFLLGIPIELSRPGLKLIDGNGLGRNPMAGFKLQWIQNLNDSTKFLGIVEEVV